MRKFTDVEDQFLKENYLTMPVKRMSKALGRADTVARQRLKLLGLVVPPDVIEKFTGLSRFKKGSVPASKGKKQTEYMSNEAIERTKATRFKKGQLPHNTKTDFEISVRLDNRGVKYKWIRIGFASWIPLHRYNWERVHGRIPYKLKLIFKDGDTMNCEINNLELLTSAQLMKRNSFHNYPKPIANTIQLRGALNRQINKHLKKLRNEKQNK